MTSYNFDRAAAIYNETRGHPAQVSKDIAESLLPVLSKDARLLDIGIGTGRTALPLAELGFAVTGVDLSTQMMARLKQDQSPQAHPIALIQADGLHLPLADQSFDAIFAVHVFHLLNPWGAAVQEILRVRKTQGVFITGFDRHDPQSPSARIRDQWHEILISCGVTRTFPGPDQFNQVKVTFAQQGAMMEEWEAARWYKPFTPAHYIQMLENRAYSTSWVLTPEEMNCSLDQLKVWAVAEFGDLNQSYDILHQFFWQRFYWP